jgi:voltage-gated potassium channel
VSGAEQAPYTRRRRRQRFTWRGLGSRLVGEVVELLQIARREHLTRILVWLVLIVCAASLVFFFAEHGHNPRVHNLWDALYWGVVSLTTTGYGDVTPLTRGGRDAAVVLLLAVLLVMPLLYATITSIYVSRRIRGEEGLDRIACTDHLVICGWNNNGHNVLSGLSERQIETPVVIVGEITADHFRNICDTHPGLELHFARGPYTSEPTLQRANIRKARCAIVLVSYSLDSTKRSDELAVLAVLALRELGPNLRIVAECFESAYRGHLSRAGANRVVVSGELDGFMLTAAALSPGLDTTVKDALTFGSGSEMWTEAIPAEFVGRTFKDLAIQWLQERNWVLVGLVREKVTLGIADVLGSEEGNIEEFILRTFERSGRGGRGYHHHHFLNPGPHHVIRAEDQAIVIYPAEPQHG